MTATSSAPRCFRYKRTGALLLTLLSAPLHAQTVATTRKLTMQGQAEQSGTSIVRDPLGRPCLDVEAAARTEAVNPDLLDHVVSVKNNCSRLIKVKVCYLNSDRCNSFDLLAYKRVDTILGTMNKIAVFRYSLFQK